MARCTASRRAQRGRPATACGCSVGRGCSLTQNKVYLFERQLKLLNGKWLGKMGNMEQGPNGSRDPGIGHPGFLGLMWHRWEIQLGLLRVRFL